MLALLREGAARRRARAFAAALPLLAAAACGPATPPATTAALPLGGRPERKVVVVYRSAPGAAEAGAVEGRNGRVTRRYAALRMIAATLPADRIAELASDPAVAWVDDDVTVEALGASSPEYATAWSVARIGADAAHASGVTGRGVKVAILDTGVDYLHPDLAPNYAGGVDLVFGDGDPMDDSTSGHGTHVAGIVAAILDGAGVVGVAPDASLYAVKVLDGGGFGDLSTILAGIDWSIANGMHVVNMSLGTTMDVPSLQEGCDRAAAAGLVLVAGTGRRSTDPVSYPAAYPSVLGVGATDASDLVTSFSPQGPEVSLVAPGVAIVSTQQGGLTQALTGTSQAAPHVAGAAALVLSRGVADQDGDGLVGREVAELLRLTARDLGPVGPDDGYGCGLVDVAAASRACVQETLLLARDSRSARSDEREVAVDAGPYRLAIENRGLTRLAISVYEGATLRRDLSTTVWFRSAPARLNVDLSTSAAGRLVLAPEGKLGAEATVTVVRGAGGCP
jgi:subtilisin